MENNKRPTQADKVMRYMEQHGSIDFMRSWSDLGISRLSARISEIENERNIPVSRQWCKFKAKDGTNVKYVKYSIGV